MKLWKSVVGKLWMTIIGLVAVVLVINGAFMGQFLEPDIANSKDQSLIMQKLAVKISRDLARHTEETSSYIEAVNELLAAQDAVMIIVDDNLKETVSAAPTEGMPQLKATELFSPEALERVIREGEVSMASTNASGKTILAVAVPVPESSQSGTHAALILYQSQIVLDYTQAYVKRLFLIAGIIGFLLTTLFAFFLSSRITKPLRIMKKAADSITMGDYRLRVPVLTTDEIGELAKGFNHMTERLEESINALNEEKEHLASVLRSMTDAVVTFDADGNVILTNPQGEKLLREWHGIQWDDPHPDDVSRHPNVPLPLQGPFESVLRGSSDFITKLHVQNGVFSVVMTPLYSKEGIRGAVAVLRDVTEEFRLEKLRKDFVANVSHELRTPISMLQGYSEALLDDIAASPEERREMVQIIYDESLRMGRLVSDLLDLARMEAGHLEFHPQRVDLSALLQRVHRKFSALCKERGIALHLRIPDRPLYLDQADEDRLEQVMTNLLDNAVRHTPSGKEIEIRADRTTDKGKPSVLVQVADKGTGIPPEHLPYIFERFYKANKARTRGVNGGTGLGLAIVKNIVEAHGGTIRADSAPGEGTTFSMVIPVRST